MYLDEVFNNFLGTLRPLPDLRENNPSLEHGKFVNDRSKLYAGKSIMISTDNTIDGSGKNTEIKVHVPAPCLIERSSGPEYDSIIEGFNIGSRVVEGNQNQCGASADQRASLQTAIGLFNTRNETYRTALNEYNQFKQNITYSQFFGSYVKVVTRQAAGTVTEESVTYYINNYGFRYIVPKNEQGVATLPTGAVPGLVAANVKLMSQVQLALFPVRSNEGATYTVQAGQDLTLAGKMVVFSTTVNNVSSRVYVWVDIEGIAHKFDPTILSDVINNASATCQSKLSMANTNTTYPSEAAFLTALGGTGLVGVPIDATNAATYICSEFPNSINEKKKLLDEQELRIKELLTTIYTNLPSCTSGSSASASSSSASSSINSYITTNQDGSASLNLPPESAQSVQIRKRMPTYDGKVSDTFKNVKSKLAYYVLWLALMIFIVVVTFRNMANSEGPDSGSFQASAAVLVVLIIYLFNFLSNMRVGPQQALNDFFGALPEKVSGMMKFSFT